MVKFVVFKGGPQKDITRHLLELVHCIWSENASITGPGMAVMQSQHSFTRVFIHLHKHLQRTLKLTLMSTLLSRCTHVTESGVEELAGTRTRRVDSSNRAPFTSSFLVSVAIVVDSIPSRVLSGLSTSKLNISWALLPSPMNSSLLQAMAVDPIVWQVNVTSVLAHATCPSRKVVLVIFWAFVQQQNKPV